MKVDTKGWKTLARTVRPLIERILEEQVREAGYFISLMSRLVVTYPNWACQVVGNEASIDTTTRQRFNALVAQTTRPGASKGRPVVAPRVIRRPRTREEVRNRVASTLVARGEFLSSVARGHFVDRRDHFVRPRRFILVRVNFLCRGIWIHPLANHRHPFLLSMGSFDDSVDCPTHNRHDRDPGKPGHGIEKRHNTGHHFAFHSPESDGDSSLTA